MIERSSEQYFEELKQVLVNRGENAEELKLWQDLFASLSEEEQQAMLMLLNEELETLRKLG